MNPLKLIFFFVKLFERALPLLDNYKRRNYMIINNISFALNRLYIFCKTIFGGLLVIGLAACAHQGDKQVTAIHENTKTEAVIVEQPTILKSPVEQWHQFNTAKKPTNNKINVVFMRGKKAIQARAINIFINGEYLTSLLPGGFKSTYVCSGSNYIGIAETAAQARYTEKNTPQYSFDLHGNEKRYFQIVADGQGQPIAQLVTEKQARTMLRKLKEQNHVISRVDKNKECVSSPNKSQTN